MRRIPKVFHRIWLDEPIPERFEEYWRRLQEMHPDWEFVTWSRSGELDWLRCRREFDGAQTAAGKADVLRYEIMYRHGGVYVDTDVEPLRPFDPLLKDPRPFAAWENDRLLCITVLGSPPQHPAFDAVLSALPEHVRQNRGKPPNYETGPEFFTTVWRGRDDVRRLPPMAFYPVGWWEKHLLGGPYPPESYAVHHWVSGWKDELAGRRTPATTHPNVRPSKISVLIPFRDDDGHRTQSAEWIRERWAKILPEAEIVFGTDDGGVPFSKTTAVNDAFLKSTGEVLVVTDADTWADEDAVRAGIAEAMKTQRLVIPWRKSYRLRERDSKDLLSGRPMTPSMLAVAEPGPEPQTGGMLLIISRSAFERVNGMDPRFRGWGYEDVSFVRCCDTLLGRKTIIDGRAYALWHPRPTLPGKGRVWKNDAGQANKDLQARYVRAFGRRAAMDALVAEHPLDGVSTARVAVMERSVTEPTRIVLETPRSIPQRSPHHERIVI